MKKTKLFGRKYGFAHKPSFLPETSDEEEQKIWRRAKLEAKIAEFRAKRNRKERGGASLAEPKASYKTSKSNYSPSVSSEIICFLDHFIKSIKFLFFSLSFLPFLSFAQDFTNIHKQKPFQIGGDISFQSMSNLPVNTYTKQAFSFIVSLNLRPKIYGIDIPLSASFSKEGFGYSQPFNQLSFTPSYKWIKAYIGKSSMSFSPYGLSGHSFTGFGIELHPKNIFSIGAMYGQFVKARQGDTSQNNPVQSTYQRMGYAVKFGINLHNQELLFHFFKASDNVKSLQIPFITDIQAKENVVIGVDAKFSLYKEINISASFALSEFCQDKTLEKHKIKGMAAAISGIFIPHRISSSIHTAYKLGLNYKTFSLSYERISPDYQTLGSPYFTNDFENIVFNCNQSFKKLSFYLNLGLQRDDLEGEKISKMLRFVGSTNITWQIHTEWMTAVSYSNFIDYTQVKPMQLDMTNESLAIDLDTLSFRQISQQAQWSINYNEQGQGKIGQQFSFLFSFQESAMAKQKQKMQYYFVCLQYSRPLFVHYQFTPSLNMSGQKDAADIGFTFGPSLQLSRSFFEKSLHCGLSTQYYLGLRNEHIESNICSLGLRNAYILKKKHRFDLSIISQIKFFTANAEQAKKNQTDFSLQLSYAYTF